jgi:hypothetical protein
MKRLITLLAIGMVFGNSLFAKAPTDNCRLVIHIVYDDDSKKVRFEEVGAVSHPECKRIAQQREIDSQEEGVRKVRVILKYRELSVLGDEEASVQ